MSNFIVIERNFPARVQLASAERTVHSLETAAQLADVHPEMIRYYCRLGLLGTAHVSPETDPLFDDEAVYELRRIEHYRHHFGVNRQALPLVIGLLREVEQLQVELQFHRHP